MMWPFLKPTDTLLNTIVCTFHTPSQNASNKVYITILVAFETLVQLYYLSLLLHLSIRVHLTIQYKQSICHLIAPRSLIRHRNQPE